MQHRFLHGIRRSSCWPVASPLAFARLTCPLPFPILNQPSGYGDLLPQSGDEDEEGDLLPHSGDENGEGIPPSQGNEPAVLYEHDLQPPIKWKLGNNLGILSPKSNGVASAFAAIFHEEHAWSATCPVKSLQHGHFMKMFAEDEVITSSRSVALMDVFDPGGILHLREPPSGVEMGILPPPHVTKQHDILLYLLMVDDFDPGGYQLLHPTFLSYALLTPGSAILHSFYTSIWLRGRSCNMRNVGCLHNIYIDDKNANCSLPASPRLQAAADAGRDFLIPLRGRRYDQWNDEAEHEDVAASKMKTKRTRKLMRLFYLTKDVLDPG